VPNVLNDELARLLGERDDEFKRLNKEYRLAVEAAEDQRRRERKKVEEVFEAARKGLHK
jgi:hypothetical protein